MTVFNKDDDDDDGGCKFLAAKKWKKNHRSIVAKNAKFVANLRFE